MFRESLPTAPPIFRTDHPRRNILLGFPGTTSAIGEHVTVVKYRGLRLLEAAEKPSRTGLVIELDEPPAHDVSVRDNELWITLKPLPTGSACDSLQF